MKRKTTWRVTGGEWREKAKIDVAHGANIRAAEGVHAALLFSFSLRAGRRRSRCFAFRVIRLFYGQQSHEWRFVKSVRGDTLNRSLLSRHGPVYSEKRRMEETS
ncbi:MAG: hypothetical protein D6694_11060, partial [Gammaproteobacteria bacterium]